MVQTEKRVFFYFFLFACRLQKVEQSAAAVDQLKTAIRGKTQSESWKKNLRAKKKKRKFWDTQKETEKRTFELLCGAHQIN